MHWFWLNLTSLVRFLLFGFSLPNESMRLWYFVVVKTETHRDWQIYLMSRPRFIETENFFDVKTGTHQDLKISLMSRLRLIETENFLGCQDWDSSHRDQDQSRLGKRWRYQDSIETLADIWHPISEEGGDLCTLNWIFYDTGLLVGLSGFLGA